MKRIIYQILPRLWMHGKMSNFSSGALRYFKDLGVDYMWYTGIPRHATGLDFVKGVPGSPYSISDWRDVNPYLADNPESRMDEFRELVDRTHAAGMKVCIDYIPNHVARDYEGKLPRFDYYDYDWSDTLKVDWSDPGTLPEMTDILRFWASMGVDAFRCDMVELVPAEALGSLVSAIKAEFPDVLFIAEVYGKDNYRRYLESGGFDLLYDKSGVYDILRGICSGRGSAMELTWNWQRLGDMQPKMVNFLENHDEQRIASHWFCGSAGKTYAALAFAMLYNDASFLMYFGQEVGESAAEGQLGRTSIFNWCNPAGIDHLACHALLGVGLNESEKNVLDHYKELLSYARRPLFAEGAVWDLCYCQDCGRGFDPDRHFAFVRYNDDNACLVVCNFSEYGMQAYVSLPEELWEYAGGCKGMEVNVPSYGYRVYFLV